MAGCARGGEDRMPLAQIRKTAVKKMTEIATSERVMKLLGDPRVQKAMMGALKLQADLRSRWESHVTTVAGHFHLATQKDISALKRRIRDLETQLRKVQTGSERKPKSGGDGR
jgi:hypothetical protein